MMPYPESSRAITGVPLHQRGMVRASGWEVACIAHPANHGLGTLGGVPAWMGHGLGWWSSAAVL